MVDMQGCRGMCLNEGREENIFIGECGDVNDLA